MRQTLTVLIQDSSIEATKATVNEFCKVGTHVNIVDESGKVLEYVHITNDSKDSFKTKPYGGIVCPVELAYRYPSRVNTPLIDIQDMPPVTFLENVLSVVYFSIFCFFLYLILL